MFKSIAGETTHTGRPAAFIRLAGCNLRCRWCDTQKAWDAGRDILLSRAIEVLLAAGDRLVVVTGGEPLLQASTPALCRGLLEQGREVLLETNGSLDIGWVPEGVRVILDLKPPSSGEHEKNHLENLSNLRPQDEVKVVVADRSDFDWATEVLQGCNIPESVNILFSPASEQIEPRVLAGWLIESGEDYRMQVQLHKLLWPDGQEGGQILDESQDSQ